MRYPATVHIIKNEGKESEEEQCRTYEDAATVELAGIRLY